MPRVKGYGDITAGASVTIRDASGTVVAVGALQAGYPGGIEDSGFEDSDKFKIATWCMFRFEVPGVPAENGSRSPTAIRSPIPGNR